MRFVEERQVSEFQRHSRERRHEFEVNHLAQSEDPRQCTFGLTPEQYEALVAAVQDGYFEVPRTTSAAELGERLGSRRTPCSSGCGAAPRLSSETR